jgi:hypothetical protein
MQVQKSQAAGQFLPDRHIQEKLKKAGRFVPGFFF